MKRNHLLQIAANKGFVNVDVIVAILIAILINHLILELMRWFYDNLFKQFNKFANKTLHKTYLLMKSLVDTHPIYMAILYDFHNGAEYIGLKSFLYYKATPYIIAKKSYIDHCELTTIPVVFFSDAISKDIYVDDKELHHYFLTLSNLKDIYNDINKTESEEKCFKTVVSVIDEDNIVEGALLFILNNDFEPDYLFEKERELINNIKLNHMRMKKVKKKSISHTVFDIF
jgi:hypothetical protein